jgi:hypothetical protein
VETPKIVMFADQLTINDMTQLYRYLGLQALLKATVEAL